MNETSIVKEIQVALAGKGCRIWRNNVGMYRNPVGQPIRYGLGTGSSDLIGLTMVKITPEHVGKTLAVFTACEVKRPGEKPTPAQENFISAVQSAGGIAFVAHSADEAEHKLANI